MKINIAQMVYDLRKVDKLIGVLRDLDEVPHESKKFIEAIKKTGKPVIPS